MKSRVAYAWALVSCLVAGCNDHREVVAVDSSSGSDTGTGESSTGEPPFEGVRFNTVVTFVDAEGVISTGAFSPIADSNSWTLEIGTGAEREIHTGYYDPVGWYEFPDVPEEPYVLRRTDWNDMSWVKALDMRELMADGTFRAGRSTAILNEALDTQIFLTVSSMTAVEEGDRFELYSRNVDALENYVDYWEPPAFGSTSLDRSRVSWQAENVVGHTPAVDPAAGDDLWLTHLQHVPVVIDPLPDALDDVWRDAQSRRLVEVAALELDEALTDHVSAEASGSFVPVARAPVSLDLRLDEIHAELRTIVGSQVDVVSTHCALQIAVAPGEDVPLDGTTPSLAWVSVNNGCLTNVCEDPAPPPGDRVVEVRVGNPFGFGTEMLALGCSVRSFVVHPEEQDWKTAHVELWFTRPLDGGGLVVPALGMPSDIRIGDEPSGIDDVLTGVGTTPSVSLSAPSLGTADYYEITVVELTGAPYGDSPSRVGGFETAATTFTLPDGLLEPGRWYRLEIEAHSGRRLGEGRPYSHAQSRSNSTSGAFTP